MEPMAMTFNDYLMNLQRRGDWVKIAILVAKLMAILEDSIFHLGIYAFDAHLKNWMVNSKGELFMTDFGRVGYISKMFEKEIENIRPGDRIITFTNDQWNPKGGSQLNGKVLTIISYLQRVDGYQNQVRVKLDNGKIFEFPKYNVFPEKIFYEKLFALYVKTFQESICYNITSSNKLNPLSFVCELFKNHYKIFENPQIYRRLAFVLISWKNGWDGNLVYEKLIAKGGQQKKTGQIINVDHYHDWKIWFMTFI